MVVFIYLCWSFHNEYAICQIYHMYTLNIYNFICQLYLSKGGGSRKIRNVPREGMQGREGEKNNSGQELRMLTSSPCSTPYSPQQIPSPLWPTGPLWNHQILSNTAPLASPYLLHSLASFIFSDIPTSCYHPFSHISSCTRLRFWYGSKILKACGWRVGEEIPGSSAQLRTLGSFPVTFSKAHNLSLIT